MRKLLTSLFVMGLLLGSQVSVSAGDVTGIYRSWVGQHKSRLIELAGAPVSSMSDGYAGEIMVYEIHTTETSPGMSYPNANLNARSYGNNVYGNVFGATVYIPPQSNTDTVQLLFWITEKGEIYKITSNKEMQYLANRIEREQSEQMFKYRNLYIAYNGYKIEGLLQSEWVK